ncbi:MAG: hypothetical protein BWY64_02786 [bacterium ADurb.Bin363]|nr:MAG: hypothetical protein BWY64_02786 [bacterium ADurb.Bin363]
MLSEIIIHNEISLDGYIDGYEANMGLYCSIAARFGAD